MKLRLILASASPRRRELLQSAGLRFDVIPSSVSEALHPGEPPPLTAERLAREKAREVASRRPGALVLGADTLVVLEGEILGKPPSEAAAAETLRRLAGRTHHVITGVALVSDGIPDSFSVRTEVTFRPLRDEEIEAYVRSREPMDKAGAYGIQGGAAGFVRSIHGSYSNVVGLPLAEVLERLAAHSS